MNLRHTIICLKLRVCLVRFWTVTRINIVILCRIKIALLPNWSTGCCCLRSKRNTTDVGFVHADTGVITEINAALYDGLEVILQRHKYLCANIVRKSGKTYNFVEAQRVMILHYNWLTNSLARAHTIKSCKTWTCPALFELLITQRQ